jgi:hypothetical protein
MKKVKGWWFAPKNKKLANSDGRKIKLGATHKVGGKIIPCRRGLHLSPRLTDALRYAPSGIVYRVEGSGTIVPHGKPIDKYACSERTYLKGGVDCSDVLLKFARLCALDVIDLWDAPDVVVKWLKTGDEKLMARAYASAGAWWRASVSVGARASAWESAWESVIASARASASARVNASARTRGSVMASARESAMASASASGSGSAWESELEKQNRRLTSMVSRLLSA